MCVCLQAVYHLVAVARGGDSDSSQQPHSATVSITVRLDDVNDNRPEFVLPSSVVTDNSTGRCRATVLMSDRARPGHRVTAV